MPLPVTSRNSTAAVVAAVPALHYAVLSLLPSPWDILFVLILAGASTLLLLRACHRAALDRDRYGLQLQQLQRRVNQRDRHQFAASYRAGPDGILLDASSSFRKLLPGSIPGRVWDCFERPDLWAEISQEAAARDHVDREVRIRQSGALVHTLQRFWAVRDANGRMVEIEASVLDVTAQAAQSAHIDRMQALLAQAGRDLEQKNEEIQDHGKTIALLRQQIAHDRRDSLEFIASLGRHTRRPIASLLQLAGSVGERSGGSLAEATASARNLLGWLDNISEFASLEITRPATVREPFSLRQVVDQAVCQVALASEKKGSDLGIAISLETPDLVLGDGPRVEQMLTYLLETAVACGDSGVISLRVSAPPAQPTGLRVEFHLAVSGAGLPPAVMDYVSNPLCGSVNRGNSEIGLRLAIARQLARRMNGSLDLHNEPGNGTRIQLSLPLAVQLHDAAARTDLTALHGVSILVVESRAGSREALAETLRSWRMEVVTAPQTETALELLQQAAAGQRPFRILLIDAAAPPNGGLQLAEFVLDNPALHPVHAILVLPHSHRQWQNEPLLPGLRASVSKPLCERELTVALLDCLRTDQLPEPAPPSRRVLIAEDDAVNRRLAIRLVQRMGYEVDGVSDGSEAFDALQLRPYGLVLMDCIMPVMDGFQATTMIRQSPGSARNVPIIALTANALAGDRRRCLDAGMNDYMSKPFTYEDLRASIERWIDAANPLESAAARDR